LRREGTAKQPENFGAFISRYPMITMHVARLARFRYSRSKQLKPCDSAYGHNASYRSHAVGRKNWLFIGSLRAKVRNASLMSRVASALRQALDLAMYLESVITHMLRGTAKTQELLPDRWTAAHPRGGARAPRVRATRQSRYGCSASSTASGTSRAPQRQIVRQKIHVRSGVYPCVSWALRTDPLSWATCVCGVSLATTKLAPQDYKPQHPSRAPNRPWAHQQT
jgi:hypothetical protein